MRYIYIYCCLLHALSVVEMNPLNVVGHVGQTVSFTCSNWNVFLTSTEDNVKYLCQNPCDGDEDIILKAGPGERKTKDRINLNNRGKDLIVTFNNLQMSDSKKYLCGLSRFMALDEFIEVNLIVSNATLPGPKTTPKPVIRSTLPVQPETTTDVLTTYSSISTTSLAAAEATGGVAYLIVGFIVMVTLLLLAMLMLYRRMTRKPPMLVSSAESQEDAGEANIEYEEIEIRGEGRPTQRPPVTTSTVYSSVATAGEDPTSDVYANITFHQDTELYSMVQLPKDLKEDSDVYSMVQLPKDLKGDSANSTSSSNLPARPTGQCAENRATDPQSDPLYTDPQSDPLYSVLQKPECSTPRQLHSSQNDSLYSFVQLPKST